MNGTILDSVMSRIFFFRYGIFQRAGLMALGLQDCVFKRKKEETDSIGELASLERVSVSVAELDADDDIPCGMRKDSEHLFGSPGM